MPHVYFSVKYMPTRCKMAQLHILWQVHDQPTQQQSSDSEAFGVTVPSETPLRATVLSYRETCAHTSIPPSILGMSRQSQSQGTLSQNWCLNEQKEQTT